MRRRVIVLVAGFAVVLPLAWTTPAQAAFVTDNLQVQVTGNPLTNITANPASLIPAFAQGTHDYYVGCQPNVNTLTFQLTGSGSITVGSQTGSSVAVTEGMVESEALVVQTPDPVTPATTTQYWIRCLPHDFPPLAVTKTFSAPAAPGYYLTGTFTSGASGKSAPYAMILDQNGVPVWYQKTPSGAVNVELLPNETDTLAWIRSETLGLNPTASFELHNLDTQAVSHVQAVQGPTDPHELLETATGDRWLIGTPVIPYDLSSSPWSTTAAIFDCVVQELDASGNEVFSWTASQHINLSEAADASPNLGSVLAVNGTSAADIYHCNSVDVDSSGNLLVSMRDTDAVYLVAGPGSATPGKIVWKLGGTTSNLGPDSEDTLTFVNDPETPSSGPNSTISGQHDARFQPNGEISLYDDHTLGTGVGRGVEYAIDPVGMTATFVYQVPGTQPSSATGSFRRYADQNGVYGNDNLVDWGLVGLPGFTEVDGAQPTPKVLFAVTFPNKEFQYRAIKVPVSALNIALLRQTAGLGWEPHGGVLAQAPTVSTWGPGRLDTFVSGTDGMVWHHWLDANGWHWEPLGRQPSGVTPTSVLSAVSWASGRIDVFGRFSDGALWHDFCDAPCSGSSWLGWESLGGALAADPAVVSPGSGSLDVFVQGTDNQLWRASYRTSTGWRWRGLGGRLAAAPAAVAPGSGEVDAFVEGTDRALWKWSSTGSTWAASLGGVLAGKPAVASWGSGRIDVAVEGTDSALWHWSNASGWDGQAVGGILAAPPSMVTWASPELDVFVEGTDRALWHARWNGTAWQWEGLGGQLHETPAAATGGTGRLDVVTSGVDASLQHLTAN